ncbi:MAG: glycosyltransferase [Syntrophorhabdaceae bacterium]|jgi:glycosyltransferase involved in cell wall biosynthesis|nr:glycosyltransferase [Syntrophorhabdaceae bacterium]MDD5243127.1 glycosyltransferase [Syntrophorhabdaceae bacterium]
MAKISVIIPCYNHGEYIEEAVESVLGQTYQDIEIIIINDGSTDELTNRLLSGYTKPKTRVLATPHQGLADARNEGIKESRGEYILPLDADDTIGSRYAEEAVKILDNDANVGIVYCEAEMFGEKTGRWNLREYSLQHELVGNRIFCSAFFRRQDWEAAGGYNPNMLYGYEDWDLWLSLIELGRGVYKLPEVHFFYRVRKDSMVQKIDEEKRRFLLRQIYLNHLPLYGREFPDPINLYLDNQQLNNSYDAIRKSKDYALGKFILDPLRVLKRFILK